jgi:predicted nuclease of predicted toxin-antitoxin system
VTFLFDHDVPEDSAYALEAMGHNVIRLRTVLPTNASDQQVWQYANAEGYLLVTCNRDDFLSLISDTPFAGLIILVRRSRGIRRAPPG